MEGKIIEFNNREGQGKIKTEKGVIKHFKIDDWFEEYRPEKGMIVTVYFNEENNIQKVKRLQKKSLQNKKKSNFYSWVEPKDFVMTRSGEPKYGKVFEKYEEINTTSDTPSSGKEILKKIVKQNGGNALLNLSVEKLTGSRGTDTGGTYYYTYFKVSGSPAFIALKNRSKTDNLIESKNQLMLKADNFLSNIKESYNPYTKSGLWEKDSDFGKAEDLIRKAWSFFN